MERMRHATLWPRASGKTTDQMLALIERAESREGHYKYVMHDWHATRYAREHMWTMLLSRGYQEKHMLVRHAENSISVDTEEIAFAIHFTTWPALLRGEMMAFGSNQEREQRIFVDHHVITPGTF